MATNLLKMIDLSEQAAKHGFAVDKALVNRAAGGDMSAFEQLYHANMGRVYALCLRMTANRLRAEEMTQETFVQAWKSLDRYRGESLFSSWLHRIAVNTVLSEQRSRKRRTAQVTSTDDLSRVDTVGVSDQPHLRMDLESAISQLPEGAREVFVLYQVEGYKHAEVAALMGITESTSKVQLHRARKTLREVLKS
jgi:RNA polymerase sigma-70 factor (ECF subfamily)